MTMIEFPDRQLPDRQQPRGFPMAIDAERALLGAVLQRQELLDDLGIRPVDFYRPEHRDLYELLLAMRHRSEEIDAVTVPMAVEHDKNPDRYGGVAYVVQLPDHCPAWVAAPHYASLIRRTAAQRTLLTLLHELGDRAYTEGADELAAEARNRLDHLDAADASAWQWYGDLVEPALDRVRRIAAGEEVMVVPTGHAHFDERLGGGLPRGGLVVVAGRPGMGKSAFALELCHGACVTGGQAGFISMEMRAEEVYLRSVGRFAGAGVGQIRSGELADQALEDAAWSAGMLELAVVDQPGLTLERISAEASALDRAARRRGRDGLSVLVVDYLQLCSLPASRDTNRAQLVADLAQGLKNLALRLGCVVIACSQLNRGVETRAKKHPTSADLRDSGGIEQAADMVLLLYRDEYYHPDRTENRKIVEVDVAKNRNGPAGWLHPLLWDPAKSAWWEFEERRVTERWESRRLAERGGR